MCGVQFLVHVVNCLINVKYDDDDDDDSGNKKKVMKVGKTQMDPFCFSISDLISY